MFYIRISVWFIPRYNKCIASPFILIPTRQHHIYATLPARKAFRTSERKGNYTSDCPHPFGDPSKY